MFEIGEVLYMFGELCVVRNKTNISYLVQFTSGKLEIQKEGLEKLRAISLMKMFLRNHSDMISKKEIHRLRLIVSGNSDEQR